MGSKKGFHELIFEMKPSKVFVPGKYKRAYSPSNMLLIVPLHDSQISTIKLNNNLKIIESLSRDTFLNDLLGKICSYHLFLN